MKQTIRYLALALVCVPAILRGEPLQRQSLFHIERSKNANIIQYDAQIGPDGKLDAVKPVVAYWIRLAEKGQIEPLSWVQKEFAFGFDAEYNARNDTVALEMEHDVGRELNVLRVDDEYRVKTTIAGTAAYLEKIYIKAHRRGFLVKVEYLDVFGTDASSGEALYERLVP